MIIIGSVAPVGVAPLYTCEPAGVKEEVNTVVGKLDGSGPTARFCPLLAKVVTKTFAPVPGVILYIFPEKPSDKYSVVQSCALDSKDTKNRRNKSDAVIF